MDDETARTIGRKLARAASEAGGIEDAQVRDRVSWAVMAVLKPLEEPVAYTVGDDRVVAHWLSGEGASTQTITTFTVSATPSDDDDGTPHAMRRPRVETKIAVWPLDAFVEIDYDVALIEKASDIGAGFRTNWRFSRHGKEIKLVGEYGLGEGMVHQGLDDAEKLARSVARRVGWYPPDESEVAI